MASVTFPFSPSTIRPVQTPLPPGASAGSKDGLVLMRNLNDGIGQGKVCERVIKKMGSEKLPAACYAVHYAVVVVVGRAALTDTSPQVEGTEHLD